MIVATTRPSTSAPPSSSDPAVDSGIAVEVRA
jgi:hypothetical protein